jgi:hypothetical protein
MGKVFCLFLLLLLFVISVALYAWLSGIKTLNIWREITLGFFCLLYFAMLFHVCNYAHNFANIVRYQKALCQHTCMYGAFLFYYSLECKSQSFNKLMPQVTKNECSIPEMGTHSPQYEP